MNEQEQEELGFEEERRKFLLASRERQKREEEREQKRDAGEIEDGPELIADLDQQAVEQRAYIDAIEDELSKVQGELRRMMEWKRNVYVAANKFGQREEKLVSAVERGALAKKEIRSYRTIIKYAAIRSYVRTTQMRKTLLRLHVSMRELIQSVMHEKEESEVAYLSQQTEIPLFLNNTEKLHELGAQLKVCLG